MNRSPDAPVRVAVIGAGLIAQSVHLPHLTAADSGFDVVVLADISEPVARDVAARFGIATYTADWRAALEGVDAAVVLTGSATHAEIVLAALERDLDVLLEKPMCITPADADRIVDATERLDRIVQIGYMRRSDAVVEPFDRALDERGAVRFLRVETHEGPVDRFVAGYGIRRAEVSDADRRAFAARRREQAIEAIGDDDPELVELYLGVLLESAVHELGFLAGRFGVPDAIESARSLKSGSGIQFTASYSDLLLDYAFYTFDGLPRFRQRIDVYTDSALVSASFDSPFIRDAAGRLEIVDLGDGRERTTLLEFDREDGFRRQLTAFRTNVVERSLPAIGPRQAREDVRTCIAIARAVCTGDRVPITRPDPDRTIT